MPARQFSDASKDEAMALLKEKHEDPLSQLTLTEISNKTGIGLNNLARWNKQFASDKDPREQTQKPTARKAKTPSQDYEVRYQLELIRSQHLARAIDLDAAERLHLEAQFLSAVLRIVYPHPVEPLFHPPSAAPTEKKKVLKRHGK